MGSKVEVLQAWFERVWSNEDEATIDEMLVSDTQARGLGSQNRVGPEEFKVFHRSLLGLIGNVKLTVDKSMEDGDWLSGLITLDATRRSDGKPVQVTGNVFAKIVDGKIIDAYNHFDFLGLFEQLELLPQQSFERCLSCEKLA